MSEYTCRHDIWLIRNELIEAYKKLHELKYPKRTFPGVPHSYYMDEFKEMEESQYRCAAAYDVLARELKKVTEEISYILTQPVPKPTQSNATQFAATRSWEQEMTEIIKTLDKILSEKYQSETNDAFFRNIAKMLAFSSNPKELFPRIINYVERIGKEHSWSIPYLIQCMNDPDKLAKHRKGDRYTVDDFKRDNGSAEGSNYRYVSSEGYYW